MTSEEEKLCVKILGDTIVYVANQVAEIDAEYREKLSKLDDILEWKIGDDITFYIIIKDGKVEGYNATGKTLNLAEALDPTLTFTIEDVDVGLQLLTGRLDLEKAEEVVENSDPEKTEELRFILEAVGKQAMENETIKVRMLISTMMRSIEEILKIDEEFQEEIEDHDGVIQWNIEDTKAWMKFENGEYSFRLDEEYPTSDTDVIITADAKTAIGLISGKIDGAVAYMSGDLQLEGNFGSVIGLQSIVDYVEDWLEPISDARDLL